MSRNRNKELGFLKRFASALCLYSDVQDVERQRRQCSSLSAPDSAPDTGMDQRQDSFPVWPLSADQDICRTCPEVSKLSPNSESTSPSDDSRPDTDSFTCCCSVAQPKAGGMLCTCNTCYGSGSNSGAASSNNSSESTSPATSNDNAVPQAAPDADEFYSCGLHVLATSHAATPGAFSSERPSADRCTDASMHSACSSPDTSNIALGSISHDATCRPTCLSNIDQARQAEFDAGYVIAQQLFLKRQQQQQQQQQPGLSAVEDSEAGEAAEIDADADDSSTSAQEDGSSVQRITDWLKGRTAGARKGSGVGVLGLQQLRPVKRSTPPPSSGSSRRSGVLMTIPSGVELHSLGDREPGADVPEEEVLTIL